MQQLPDCHMSMTSKRQEQDLFDPKAPECCGSTTPTGKVLNKQCDYYQECSRIKSLQQNKSTYAPRPTINLPIMQQPLQTNVPKPQIGFQQRPVVPATSYTVPTQTYTPRPQPQIPQVSPQVFQQHQQHLYQQQQQYSQPAVPQQQVAFQQPQYLPYPQVQMPQMAMAPANFQVPAYLTNPEAKADHKLRGFGVDMLRSMGKAAGQTMAHFFDTVSLGG